MIKQIHTGGTEQSFVSSLEANEYVKDDYSRVTLIVPNDLLSPKKTTRKPRLKYKKVIPLEQLSDLPMGEN